MNILVRGTNWIGDAVMSVPALRRLRAAFPDSRIVLHTRSWADGLFRDADFIDEIVTYDPKRWRIQDIYDNSRFLKDDNYDLAILLPNSFESAITAALSRIPRRIGYNKDSRGLLLTDPIAVPEWKSRRHEAFYYSNLIGEVERRVLGHFDPDYELKYAEIGVSTERIAEARAFLADNGVDLSRPVAAFGAGSTNSNAKRWPVERFADLADRLIGERNMNVILLGSKNEAEINQRLVSLSRYMPIDLSGRTSLDEAVGVLAASDLMVTNDMGLAHVAPAVGVRTLVIFGPTDPQTTSPFSDKAAIIRHPVDCSPCMLRECPIDHRCMTRISVDDVLRSLDNSEDVND